MDNLYGSLCLSDIPKELITTGKNGKKYLNIVVNKRKEVSQFGNTHYVKAYVKKALQKEGQNYYIGELKPSERQPGSSNTSSSSDPNAQKDNDDDLPF